MSRNPHDESRRRVLAAGGVLGAAGAIWSALPFATFANDSSTSSPGGSMSADLILFNGRLHTVDP
ncbi:hypothetical protein, partial [Pseudomonas sp. KB-10]|uniref:hypothetical protein n=1 Tax=Pseudomonas sp. KB-10 TaxID=2292264 RepID=UPI001BAF62CB